MKVLLLCISLSYSHSLQIQVCQNKSCCKAWRHKTPLPDVLHDLLGNEEAIDATTGCFGQCQNGPNICIKRKNEPDKMLNGIGDPTTAAAHLGALASIEIPSKILAAVNVLEKAQRADSVEDKERFLSSVINALTNDPNHCQSTVLARALIFRARLYVSSKQLFEAETDAMKALDIMKSSEKQLNYLATRVLADVFEMQGNIDEAANLLQDLAITDRSMRSKLLQEVKRLRNLVKA